MNVQVCARCRTTTRQPLVVATGHGASAGDGPRAERSELAALSIVSWRATGDPGLMRPGLRRMAGAASVLLGATVALWLAFGPPQDWEGGMRWLRHGLALGSLGVIVLAARLIFPTTREGTADTVSG